MGAASISPTAILKESVGSLTLHIATFAATADDTDYWTSKIAGVVGYWANRTDAPTQTKEAIDVQFTATNSVFTFSAGEDDVGIMLYVLSRS